MVCILRFPNSCKIIEEDNLEILKALDNELSFAIQGAEFSAAYKGYFNDFGEFVSWDGRRHLMSSNGKFPAGLFQRVLDFYAERNISPRILDERPVFEIQDPINLSDNLLALNKTPRPYQIQAVETAVLYDRGIIRMATGSGKCTDKNSLIVTDRGLLTYEELLDDIVLNNQEVYEKDIVVATSSRFGCLDNTSMIYRDGYGPSKRVITSYGFENIMTLNHKIQVMSKLGHVEWKACKDLEINDYVAISYGNQIFGNQDMDLDEAYWYGLLFGDGSMTLDDRVSLTNMDSHILEFSKKYLTKIGLKCCEKKTKSKAMDISVYSKKYREHLVSLGFSKEKSIRKTIPKLIRSLKKKPLAMFIRGLYETDGWIGISTSGPMICIGLSNKKAIDQLHLLLLNFGVIASRRIKKTTHEDCHILTIYRSSIDCFMKNIGLDPNGVKYKKLNDNITNVTQNDNNYIPHQSMRLKELFSKIPRIKFSKAPVKWQTIKSWIGRCAWRNPTHNNLVLLLRWMIDEGLNINKAQDILADITGVFFNRIVAIEDVYSDNYDFVVPRTHSFVSQGFVNHNTMVAALITAKLAKPTIIFVIGKDLLYQLQHFFSEIFDHEIGIIGDGKCEIRDINIATVWSVGQALGLKNFKSLDDEDEKEQKIDPSKFRDIKSMILRSKVVILDECHIASANTIQGISKELKADYVYGMSASPWRDDGSDLLIEAFLGNKIIDISARELISKGYLVQPNIRFLAPEPYKFKSGAFQKIYSKYIVENEQRNAMIARGAVSMVEQGFVPLVLFHSIKHGDILFESLKDKIPTAILSGKDSSKVRQKIKDQLEEGKLKCIIASKIFDMGIDLPILSGLVIAGAGKSSVRALQRIGRVIRPYKGKKVAAVLDFSDQAPYLINHAIARKEIYQTEFDVTWPQEKTKKENSPG